MSEVGGPCGVENMEMRARELSVLDCLLMGCSRSWELAGQALPLAGMAGRLPARSAYRSERMPALQRSARSHRQLKPPLKECFEQGSQTEFLQAISETRRL